jgi:DNA mismatch repair ATPase MutS
MLTTQSNLSQTMITNDVTFGPEGRIFVLTGPNQGGKTTYTQASGVIQALAQAGLYVPASRARISPVDAIFTHFPVEERPNAESGRLGEEAQRLNDIFSHATRHSLILLNESLSSTSFGESLYLARDIARALRLLGARGIYATHLHELAANVNNLNETSTGDSKLVSVVSLVNENGSDSISTRTYKIVTGPPMGHSYAREIAARYGISYEQLAQTLRQRGVVPESLSKRQ